jgi:hypothetical protein
MTINLKLAVSLALGAVALLSLTPAAGAKPTQLDQYCSPTGDFCQEITLSKNGKVKFNLFSFTPAVSGAYGLCVKGPGSKQCKDFELEQTDPGVYSDKVNWEKEFRSDIGEYKVIWRYMGEKLGKALRFHLDLNPPQRGR